MAYGSNDYGKIREFLTQDTQKIVGFNETVAMFRKVFQ